MNRPFIPFRFASVLFLFIVSLLFVSCKDDVIKDVTPPLITISSPQDGATFEAGSTITFEAVFEDNTGLATFNINIHEDSDGHTHGRLKASSFSFEKTYDISGKTTVVTEQIDLPADATPGHYHFIVKAIDELGNATGFADGSTRELEITITEKPGI